RRKKDRDSSCSHHSGHPIKLHMTSLLPKRALSEQAKTLNPTYEIEESGQRESNPIPRFHNVARFPLKSALINALTAFAKNERFADSRRFTQFSCPNLSEILQQLFAEAAPRRDINRN